MVRHGRVGAGGKSTGPTFGRGWKWWLFTSSVWWSKELHDDGGIRVDRKIGTHDVASGSGGGNHMGEKMSKVVTDQ